ncbi:hypothetical protein KUTeg_002807 [Tegillarca granosa]|uniref:Uncharacterized protein n=1 Tax=Tegillarca granosa TaxID=220873 RepID=A0ABQ9FQU3_TEGGR|nr:hypothetical protein KUTeg_002807 [Tegillarca granosa]
MCDFEIQVKPRIVLNISITLVDKRHLGVLTVIMSLMFIGCLIVEAPDKYTMKTVSNITEIKVPPETLGIYLEEQANKRDIGKTPTKDHVKEPKKVFSIYGKPMSLLPPSKTYVVPNIVHYIWIGKNHNWKFYQLLSVLSTYYFVKPDVIYFHCDYEPIGKWWKVVKQKVKTLKIVRINMPTSIFGRLLWQSSHRADIYRIILLYNLGGIYFDTDILGLKSFNDLRVYNMTVGLEYHPGPVQGHGYGRVNNGILVAAKGADYLNVWWNTYKNMSSWTEHDRHCCIIPYTLIQQHPGLVHVEEKTLNYPSGPEYHLLYKELYDYSKNYAMHLWYENWKGKYNPDNIKKLNTTFGRVARSIYYNTTDFVD